MTARGGGIWQETKGGTRSSRPPKRSLVGLVAVAAAAAGASSAATTASTSAAAAGASSAATTASTSSAAAGTSSAAHLLIGIADGKSTSHQAVNVVYLRPFYQRRALRVHKHLDVLHLDDEVVGLRFSLDSHGVLHSAVRARHYHNPEHRVFIALLLEYGF